MSKNARGGIMEVVKYARDGYVEIKEREDL